MSQRVCHSSEPSRTNATGCTPMILSRLRAATRPLHQRLETVVDLPSRLASVAAFQDLLESFYGLYQPLELRLAAHHELIRSGLAAKRLEKHLLLEADLRALGASTDAIESIPRCSRLPDLGDIHSAAGCLYVLEGATLGGQLVRREVDRRLTISTGCECLFFGSYGPRVHEMWSGFCVGLTSLAGENRNAGDSILQGASDTFTCFEDWLR
jgi:heme oxygenase (biliverdin-IX-beta and delta-forming)